MEDIFSNLNTELKFGETDQTWDTILEAIKDRCGVITEADDETIISKLRKQILPIYSKHEPNINFIILDDNDIVSRSPVIKYKIPVSFIADIKEVHIPKANYHVSRDELEVMGYVGNNLEDVLISENYQQMFEGILPTSSWVFRQPNVLEVTPSITQRSGSVRTGHLQNGVMTQPVSTENIGTRGISSHPYSPENKINTESGLLVKVGTKHQNPDTISSQDFNLVKDMCVGYLMIVIGTVRSKVNNINSPMGTIMTDGDQLKSEGEALYKESYELVKRKTPNKLLHFI